MVTVALAMATVVALPAPSSAQRGRFMLMQGHLGLRVQSHAQAPRSQPPRQNQNRGHAGDWLRRYKNMSPSEQERALRSDPGFQHLSPGQQQVLQQRMLNRMETWEHLTPGQKAEARGLFQHMQQLPPERRRMVTTAVRDLRAMPPAEREQIIDSNRFKGMFSPEEREIMRGATRLPLAPPEHGEENPAQ
jgi:hypothetical protein